jgi:hypothetical protein
MINDEVIGTASRTSLPAVVDHPQLVKALVGVLTFSLAACLAVVAILSLIPPAVAGNVPPGEFSAARARDYLKPIAQKPHPIGSAAHAEVRDYISVELTKLGLQPQIQHTTAVNTFWGYPNRAATVENIVAKLPGTANTRAVLLVAHYDAAQQSLGASDDGAAVASLLETLRALKVSAPLKNDVIFLATDGEEAGLLGAVAFTQQHPWAKDVGVVLNFEARGDHGPSIMFQTSDENGWLIEQFAQTAPRPVATSLASDIYKLLPNDTDFTVFNRAGMNGLNFAYVEGSASYHSSRDDLVNLDDRSLQHHGLYALALARRFGNTDLSGPLNNTDAVYFDLFGRTLVHYSRTTALILAFLIALLTVGAIILGVWRKRLTFSGLALGFFALLLSLISAALLAMLASWLSVRVPGSGATFMAQDTWTNHLYLIGFVLIAVTATALVYGVFRRKVSVANLAAGALLWFLLLLIVSFLYFPGGSYLLMWPLLSAVVAWIINFSLPPGRLSAVKLCLITSLCAVPGVVLMSPLIYQFFIVLGISQTLVVVVPAALLLGLFVVNFDLLTSSRRWLLPAVTGAVAIGFLIAAIAQPDFNQREPRRDEIFYALNADTGKAVWASADAQPDEWTSQFLSDRARTAAMTDDFPWRENDLFLQQQTATASLPAPEVKVLADNSQDQTRSVHLRITSRREAAQLFIYTNSDVSEGFVNGQQLAVQQAEPNSKQSWMLIYSAPPPDGIDLLLKTKSSVPLSVKVVDRSYQLPELKDLTIKARPNDVIPAPFTITDSTFVGKTFSFPPPITQAAAGQVANH